MFALLAFGSVVSATASAEEKEPPGILFLPGATAEAVTIKAEAQEVGTELRDSTTEKLKAL